MGRKKSVPGYCLHKASGRAVCRVNGRDHYLGAYGSPESRRAYAELIARLDAGADAAPPPADLTVAALVARYDAFARTYYQKAGELTRQYERVRRSLGQAVALYGGAAARDFGPLALAAVRDRMVSLGWSRRHVNACVGCVRRAWRWAASRELVPPSCFEALRALDGLRAGRTGARETAPVGPVADDVVLATLAFMRPETADMVRLQRLTAMRAGEVCALRAEQIDRQGTVWTWRMAGHKMEHAGRERVIFFGPRAQQIITPHAEAIGWRGFVFSPARTMARLRQELRKRERPCQGHPGPSRPPGECYTSNSYQKAVRAACDRAGVQRWRSHQLRHSAATAVRAEFGLAVAMVLLGHSRVETTQLYAQANLDAALDAVRRAG